ncbi:MAG: hypothetical protein WBA12_13395 [Catalinimonas sp.]
MNRVALRRIQVAISLVALIASMAGCDGSLRTTWAYYDLTRCADPWSHTDDEQEIKVALIHFLQARGVTVYKINLTNIERTGEENDCRGRTGRRVLVEVPAGGVETLRTLGFLFDQQGIRRAGLALPAAAPRQAGW